MYHVPQEDSGNFYWSLVDSRPDASLELHLEYLGVIPLHRRVQLGNLHLDVLNGNLYGGQYYLFLLSDLEKRGNNNNVTRPHEYLNPGFNIGEVVNSCEDCLPLVLVREVAMRRSICREGGGEYEPRCSSSVIWFTHIDSLRWIPANVVIPLICSNPIP